MRRAGRIENWDDAKGFGFIMPVDGGKRFFMHISAIEDRSIRPKNGLLVYFNESADEKGRPRAVSVNLALSPQAHATFPVYFWFYLILAMLSLGLIFIFSDKYLGYVFLIFSVVTFLMYRNDKIAAENRKRRVPEANLHLVSFLGGWPGALLAQQLYRHKTKKESFRATFWLTVICNIAATAALTTIGLIPRLVG